MKKKKTSKFKRWLIKKLGGVLPNKGVCYKVETQKAYLMSKGNFRKSLHVRL